MIVIRVESSCFHTLQTPLTYHIQADKFIIHTKFNKLAMCYHNTTCSTLFFNSVIFNFNSSALLSGEICKF